MNNIFTKYKMESINNFYTQSILWCKSNEYIGNICLLLDIHYRYTQFKNIFEGTSDRLLKGNEFNFK